VYCVIPFNNIHNCSPKCREICVSMGTARCQMRI